MENTIHSQNFHKKKKTNKTSGKRRRGKSKYFFVTTVYSYKLQIRNTPSLLNISKIDFLGEKKYNIQVQSN